MIFFVETLGQLRDAADNLIEKLGRDTPVGVPWRNAPNPQTDHIDGPIQLEWVCIEKATGCVVGDEAEDYELNLKPGEINAIRIS